VCELADERCEWWPSIVGAVEGTPYRGHEGIRAHFAEQRQAWDELVLLVDASGLRDVAGRIVMLGQIRGRGHASGLDLSSEYAGVLEASNGRWVRLRSFLDHAAALRFARGDP
jgi:ketosteroid isomerase-like protein